MIMQIQSDFLVSDSQEKIRKRSNIEGFVLSAIEEKESDDLNTKSRSFEFFYRMSLPFLFEYLSYKISFKMGVSWPNNIKFKLELGKKKMSEN